MAFKALTYLFLFYSIILPKLSGFVYSYFTLISPLIYGGVTDSTEVASYKFVWVPKIYLTGDEATFLSARNTLGKLGDIIFCLCHNFNIYVFPVCSVKCSRDSNCGGFYFIQSACTLLQKEWKFNSKSALITRK